MIFRWILVMLVALIVMNQINPWLKTLGIGRMPGDLHFILFGREWTIPLGSSVILSLVCAIVAKFL